MTTLLTIGPPHSLAQNQVYALPARAVYIYNQGATLELSNDGSTFAAIGTANPVAAQFIRNTAASGIVTLKAA